MDPLNQINEGLKATVAAKEKAKLDADRRYITSQLASSLASVLGPLLQKLEQNATVNSKQIGDAITRAIANSKLQIEGNKGNPPVVNVPAPQVTVKAPDVHIPEFRIPAPIVNVPAPVVRIPDFPKEMDIKGWDRLQGVDLANPLPVELRTHDGKPYNILEGITTILGGGGGGGGFRHVIVDNLGDISISSSGGLTDAELRAASILVEQVSGSIWSTFIAGVLEALPVVQLSGSSFSVEASATFPVNQVSGGNFSVFVTGAHDSMLTYEARTTNPTAKTDGADVRPKTDDLGRTLTRPMQVRDLTRTAYATLTTGTETTLRTATSGTFFDLIYILGTNNSDFAVTVDIRAETGAGIVTSIRIPANGTAGVALPVPIPQNTASATWTVDLPDITGTTVTISALFTEEI